MGKEKEHQPHSEAFLLDEQGALLVGRVAEGVWKLDAEKKDRRRMDDALGLAVFLHGDEEARDDGTPTVNHILRVADLVVNSFEVTDPDTVIAALLHDSVENQRAKLATVWTGTNPAKKLLRRIFGDKAAALRYLRVRFGAPAADKVKTLTKPDKESFPSLEARARYYFDTLQREIRDPSLFYVKLADFYDNVRSLEGAGTTEHQKQRAKKYRPVFKLFLDRLAEEDVRIPPETKKQVARGLQEAEKIIVKIAERP